MFFGLPVVAAPPLDGKVYYHDSGYPIDCNCPRFTGLSTQYNITPNPPNQMSCRPNNVLVAYNVCAVICEKPNDPPIPKFEILGVGGFNPNGGVWALLDDSTYFDDGVSANREYRWRIRVNNTIVGDLGFGANGTIIPQLTNGSTYENLILGINNADIISYINGLPNTQLSTTDKIVITLSVKDNTGVQSTTNSNEYIFYV